jgi:hypothetical protein
MWVRRIRQASSCPNSNVCKKLWRRQLKGHGEHRIGNLFGTSSTNGLTLLPDAHFADATAGVQETHERDEKEFR